MIVVRSTRAAANIARIDTSTAETVTGVLAICTGKDVAADGLGHIRTAFLRPRPDGKPMIIPLYPMLAENEVRFVGEPIAVASPKTSSPPRRPASLPKLSTSKNQA